MKSKRIILIRHGQSLGNVNKEIYKTRPDYSLPLTDEGQSQAHEAGQSLSKLCKNETVKFYYSPFWRTRQTYQIIDQYFDNTKVGKPYEDPRIREQEWGHKRGVEYNENLENERDAYGHFYWRFPDGESCADVFDRISDFLNTLFREFDKPDNPENSIIVCHGMTMRVFLMRFFHLTVEEFEALANPNNCEYWVLELMENGRYQLITPVKRYEKYNHEYQYDWNFIHSKI